jgi:hypothetical protein
LGSFQRIDGPSWPYDGPVWEDISATGILGFVRLPNHQSIDAPVFSFQGPGHVTFWTLTTDERLRATEGQFMMTSVADVESVAATG